MTNLEQFFNTLCRQKQIHNPSTEDLITYFPLNKQGHAFIPLHEYLCVCLGYRNKKKTWVKFRILKCENSPLFGSHEIEYNGKIIHVDSLTNFKKETLQFEDFVSFDRSTFIYFSNEKKVFRLHALRERLQLPLFSGGLSTIDIAKQDNAITLHLQATPANKHEISQYFVTEFGNVYDKLADEFESESDAKICMQEILLQTMEKTLTNLHDQSVMQLYDDIQKINHDVSMQMDYLHEMGFFI